MAKRRYDLNDLIDLVHQRKPNGKPYTQTEIAEKLGVTRVAIAKQLAKLSPSLLSKRDVTQYRRDRADILAELQQTLIRHITPDKLRKASLSQIVTCMAILYDKERLERAESTENVAVHVKVDSLDEGVKNKMRELIREMTVKRLEESQQTESETHY